MSFVATVVLLLVLSYLFAQASPSRTVVEGRSSRSASSPLFSRKSRHGELTNNSGSRSMLSRGRRTGRHISPRTEIE